MSASTTKQAKRSTIQSNEEVDSDEDNEILPIAAGGDGEPTIPSNACAYTVPEGFVKHAATARSNNFDASKLSGKRRGKELWLIRVPEKFPLSSLKNVTIQLPDDEVASSKSLASINSQNSTSHSLHFLSASNSTSSDSNSTTIGEMAAFDVLLPNRQGELVSMRTSGAGGKDVHPNGFSKYFAVTEGVEIPDSFEEGRKIRERQVVKKQHPEGLKMRFRPYGFDTADGLAPEERNKLLKDDPAPTSLDWDTGKKPKKSEEPGTAVVADKKKKKKITDTIAVDASSTPNKPSTETPKRKKKTDTSTPDVISTTSSSSKKRKAAGDGEVEVEKTKKKKQKPAATGSEAE